MYKMEKTTFAPHPEGSHKGTILEVKDEGIHENSFTGQEQNKISIRIESKTAMMEDGRPFIVSKWYTLSAHRKANLTGLREMLAGHKMSDLQLENFDEQAELMNRQVGFVISHNTTDTGTYANLDNIWPLDTVEPVPDMTSIPQPQQASMLDDEPQTFNEDTIPF